MKLKVKPITALDLIIPVLMLFVMIGCGAPDESGETATEDTMEAIEMKPSSSLNDAQKVFYAMPSPFEVANMLKSSGVPYNQAILNPVENLTNYSSSDAKALNLGVYGADLSYSSIFEQTQAIMLYLSCIKKLTDDLGISDAFDQGTMQRLESSMENKDSLQQIVSEAYLIANAYLKENERSNISSMILAGGWIEGLYIAVKLNDPDAPNDELINLVAEQKFSLENLIALLTINKGNHETDEMLKDLNELYDLFQQLEEEEGEVHQSTDKKNQMTVIGGTGDIFMTPEQLKEITVKTEAIRNRIIK